MGRTRNRPASRRGQPRTDAVAIDVSCFTARWRPLATVVAQIERTSGLAVGQPSETASRLDRLLGDRLDHLAIDVSTYAQRCADDAFERLLLLGLLQVRRTSWFSDPDHFTDLEQRIVPTVAARFRRAGKPVLRIWCAATGTGEEAYSIAASLHRTLPDREHWDATILATDLSIGALQDAQTGRYDAALASGLDEPLRSSALTPGSGTSARLSIRSELRRTVHFAWLDLNGPWNFTGPFDAVFCRGLLDRLEEQARRRAIARFAAVLRPGSTLYLASREDYPELAEHFARSVAPGIWVR